MNEAGSEKPLKDIGSATAETLRSFSVISLSDLERASLMERTDTKFILNKSRLPGLLEQLKSDYVLLEVCGEGLQRYESLYYDTIDFSMYTDHHKGKKGRFKVRTRKYMSSGTTYLEIKFKNNKDRTLKSRMKLGELEDELSPLHDKFIKENSAFCVSDLKPKLWSNCSRITLLNKSTPERITLDCEIQFINEKQHIELNSLVIVEVKQARYARSQVIQVLSKNKIRPGSVSKYCLGASMLYKDLKKNNFKPDFLQIDKVIHE